MTNIKLIMGMAFAVISEVFWDNTVPEKNNKEIAIRSNILIISNVAAPSPTILS